MRERDVRAREFHGNSIVLANTIEGDGGLADAVIYNSTTATGFGYSPAAASGPLPWIIFDDVPIPVSRLAGQTKVQVRKVSVLIRRAANAPACTVTVYRAAFSTAVVAPNTTNLQNETISAIAPAANLPANGAALANVLVSFGDGVTPMFEVDLNMSLFPGFGAYALGVQISGDNTTTTNNHRITAGPDTNSDTFWRHDPNNNTTGAFFFGGSPLASFGYNVEGRPNDCAAPLPHQFCVADVTNDGTINVTDLLAVIAAWGESGPPKPVADVAPGSTGDCTVNVTDLLAVIGGWGDCPATGSCCVALSCSDGLTQAQCNTAGGVFLGTGTTCAASICPPLNDQCQNATVAVSGANNFTNAGATLSPGTPGGDCTFGGATQITRDVWFKYTTGAVGGVLDLSMCNTTGAVNDTTLGVYLGTCASLIELSCNDDNCGTTFLSRITETGYIPPNTTAYIRVGSWGTDAANQGNMVMDLLFTPKTDDDCIAATNVAIGGSVTGTLGNATGDIGASCAGVSTGIGRWYTVVGNGNNLKASTCTSVPDIYDGRITVYCGTDCGGLVCVGASDTDIGNVQGPSCTAFQGEEVTFCSVNNQRYWIYVSAPNIPTGVTGNLTVSVTNLGTSCTATVNCAPNAPPANDTCDTAIVAGLGSTPFSNNLAEPQTATLNLCTQPASKDVWFNFTPTTGGATTVTVNAAAPFLDTIVAVYTGACAALTQVGCNDDPATCVGCHGVVQFTAVAGTTYRIQVANWNTAAGGFGNLVISQP